MSLLDRLRAASRESHQALDNQVFLEKITASSFACLDYLESFSRGYRRVQKMFSWNDTVLDHLPDRQQRMQRYLCLPDVEIVDLTSANNTISAEAFGALYVLEGSIHGGSAILAKLLMNDSEIDRQQFAFFQGFGDENVQYWRRFVGFLQSLELSQDEVDTACNAAVKAFAIFLEELSD